MTASIFTNPFPDDNDSVDEVPESTVKVTEPSPLNDAVVQESEPPQPPAPLVPKKKGPTLKEITTNGFRRLVNPLIMT